MRNLFKVIAAIFLASCMGKSHNDTTLTVFENSKTVTTTLKDSLGKISFLIPTHFDTSFLWTNYSDCGKPCNHEEYRFQSKTFPIFKESGFYYDIPDIPINQFTIIHSGYFPFRNNTDTTKNFGRHENFKGRLLSDPYNGKNMFDTIEKVDDRYYSFVYMSGYDTARQKYFAKVAALTTIKGNEIEFHYDIKAKDTINKKKFFDHATLLIKTIRISNGI